MERALTSIIPSLVAEGVFGDVEYKGLMPDERTEKGVQFASSLAFVNLSALRKDSEELEFPLVVKVQTEDPVMYEILDLKGQFHNEMVMYKEVLPALRVAEEWWCPDFYHGHVAEEGFEEDVLVLQNMTPKGFVKSKLELFLDFDHFSLALKRIATYHARSYLLKHDNKEELFRLAGRLKPLRNVQEILPNHEVFERPVRAFGDENGHDSVLDDFLKVLTSGSVSMESLSAAEEPFGVICHGDFCNNNVVYKYDEATGSPVECALFDYQASRYCSPAADLSFYLYFHTTAETREKYWDDYLRIYWSHLRGEVPGRIELPSFEEFLQHFASRAIYGFSICASFLPFILLKDLSEEERAEPINNVEGERKVKEIVSHCFHKKYIHAFVDSMKKKLLA